MLLLKRTGNKSAFFFSKRSGALRLVWLAIWGNLLLFMSCSEPRFSANDIVPPALKNFDFGTNMGYFPPDYNDKALAKLARNYGATSIRPGLFHHFLETWGYESRTEHFQYYDSIGLRNLVVMLGFPAESARDASYFCPGERSAVFKNLYEPIWDKGENGTPVNDQNPYALYVWKAATTYKGLIKIYEVWNEPDFDTGNGGLKPGQPGNWWENAPQPCETSLKTPSFHYIRMLRISYEVIKKVDKDAMVAVGGLGWPSYLDVICRYTDEPKTGQVDPELYPLKGGAYFDCMSFHAYPHFDNSLRVWEEEAGAFRNFRHSDAAVDGIWAQKNKFNDVLERHRYDNIVFPKKHWICSEFNLPRRAFEDYIGSESAQVNFFIKTLVTAQANGMSQMHVYSIADEKPEQEDSNPFAYMGLFQNLNEVPLGNAQPNALAWAMKTTSQILANKDYDADQTAKMNLPQEIRGAAFGNQKRGYTYVLWAVTNKDLNETSKSTYAFPESFELDSLDAKPWYHSQTGVFQRVQAQQVKLSASPIFLSEAGL